ncbi:hypothetical protein M0811_13931 [Anaeramoeba ignava]|uniref:Uncharacterized protein n=1 Tax=Anaeramoeba ignava TaxID=1746090 RepID=A0A9Q0M0E4_ANAIG|nr:hypothetical protein M0811_13931 [Anaeramoeba ignava]
MELLQAPQQSYATEYFKHSNFELKALDKYGNPVSGKTAVFYLYSYPTYVAQEILDAFLTWGSESVQVNNAITNGRQFFGIQTESTTDSNAEYLLVIQNASSSTITLNEPWDYVPQLVLLDSKYNEIDLQRVKLKTYIEGLNEDEYIITFDCGDEHTSESPTNDCYSYSYTSSSVMYFYNFQIIEFSSPNPCFQIYFVFAEGEPYELYSGLSEVYCIENYITSVTALSDVSAYTTVDTYTQSASILQTETLLGTAIQGLEPNVDVVDKPPGFADCTFQWQYFATDSLGQSYLWIELFDGCVTGRYSFIASLGGVNASTLFYIDLTDQAKYIEIVQYENNTSVDAIVGEFIPQSFEVVVKIYTLAALNGKSVTAFISGYNNSSSENVCSDEATVPDYTNVTLDAYHATEITTSNQFLLLFQYYGTESSVGTAVFNLLKFTSGKSGFYCVKFKVEDIVTSSGIVMNVINNVTEVAIVKQPSNKVKTGHRFDQQPLIKIYDNGIGLANRSITVGFYHECIGASITYNDNPITDPNGEYQFWDLTISGTGGTCQLVFISQGIASDPSSKFNIIGLSEPSFQYIGKWKSIIALTVLAFVPLFFFNEANTSTWFLVVGLLACAIPEFFGYVALEKLSFQQNQDGENSYLRLITSMFIICINILVILFAWNMVEGFMKKKNWQFYDKKKLASQKFVKYLLQKNEDMVFSAELPDVDLYDSPNESNSEIELDNFGNKVKKEKEYITHKKTIEIKNEVMDSFSDMMLSSRNRFISWIMPKQKTAHSKFEPSFSFFYPQRLILAACLTILLLIYFLAGAFLLVEWFVFYLKKWREDILGYQSRIDYIIALINESILETVTQSSSLNPAKINYIPDSIETIFKASQTQVDRLISIVKFSGRFTGIMLFLIFLFVWWLIFRLYRRRIMWLRQGVRFTKRKPNTGKATSFPGLTAATFIYGFVALWVITTAIIIVLLFFPFFNVLWFVFRWIFYTFMIGFFVMKMWEFFLLLFINRNSVTKLRCFSTAEFIWTFLNFVYGVAFASARIFRVLYFTLFHFIRVDLDTLHNISFLKRAYRSYVGMIYMDHIHNNPIRLCFGNMLERKNLKKSIAKLDLANKSSDFSPEFPNDKPKNNQDFVEEKQDLILQQKVKSRFLFLITISRNKNLINSRQRNLQISQKN